MLKLYIQSGSNFALKWNDNYKIGIKEIDDEHKQIVDHFEYEEKLQKEISYDYSDHHKNLHEDFKFQFNHILVEDQKMVLFISNRSN